VITHRHHDHVGGLPAVLRLLRDLWTQRNPTEPYSPPRIHKFPLPESHPKDERLQLAVDSLEPGTYIPGPSSPFHDLTDGQLLQYTTSTSSTAGPSTALQILHTPGHTADSICLYFPADRTLFTGDTVLGGSTSVFEDLGPYLDSLRRMLKVRASLPYTQLYPAHGPVVGDGPKMIEMYIRHRLDRERRILQVLGEATSFGDTTWTVWGIVEKMYGGITRDLWEPAARGIEIHLKKLAEEGRVRSVGGEGKHSQWQLIEG
jgi:endoribonuclease LACTB2